MLCTFCGTDNRAENKFCGMCGVRLERRKLERRLQQGISNSKCPSCEHINEAGYKFCAMCGMRVDRRVSERRAGAPDSLRATAAANVKIPGPEAPSVVTFVAEDPDRLIAESRRSRSTVRVFRDTSANTSPTISGPSFLGLNDDPGVRGDYLLDDEPSSGGVLRKLVLIAVLGSLGGLALAQWRTGFPLFHAAVTFLHPSRTASAPPSPGKIQGAAPTRSQPADNATTATGGVPNSSAGAPAEAAGLKDKLPDLVPPENVEDSPAQEPEETTAIHNENRANPSAARQKLKAARDEQETPSPLLLRAQQYLQGAGGLPQNCEQGLVYLKAAAKSEAAAAAQMGVLYASGHCVQRDRVEAYLWFNSAREMEPANSQIQTNIDQLWAQMTPQERSHVTR